MNDFYKIPYKNGYVYILKQEAVEKFVKQQNDGVDRESNKMRKVADTGVRKGIRNIESRLVPNLTTADLYRIIDDEMRVALTLLAPRLIRPARAIARITIDEINGLSIGKLETALFDDRLRTIVDRAVMNNTTRLAETTIKRLKDFPPTEETISKSFIENLTAKVYPDLQNRLSTYSQTTGTEINGLARQHSFEQSSVVTHKQWTTIGDNKVRAEHMWIDGEIVEKRGTFSIGVQNAPGGINCRCSTVGVVVDEDGKITDGVRAIPIPNRFQINRDENGMPVSVISPEGQMLRDGEDPSS